MFTDSVFVDLLRETGAKTVVWTALYEPWIAERDQKLKSKLESRGIKVKPSNLALLNLYVMNNLAYYSFGCAHMLIYYAM